MLHFGLTHFSFFIFMLPFLSFHQHVFIAYLWVPSNATTTTTKKNKMTIVPLTAVFIYLCSNLIKISIFLHSIVNNLKTNSYCCLPCIDSVLPASANSYSITAQRYCHDTLMKLMILSEKSGVYCYLVERYENSIKKSKINKRRQGKCVSVCQKMN